MSLLRTLPLPPQPLRLSREERISAGGVAFALSYWEVFSRALEYRLLGVSVRMGTSDTSLTLIYDEGFGICSLEDQDSRYYLA